jgi:hypothetical protein
VISTNSLPQLTSKAAIYLDVELDEGILKLKHSVLGIKDEGKREKLRGFEIIHDFTIAKNDELNREISAFEQDLLGKIGNTIKETKIVLCDTVGSVLVLVILSNESWNVLLSRAVSNLYTESINELSAINQYMNDKLTAMGSFILATDDELESSLSILTNQSWGELMNKVYIYVNVKYMYI